MKRSDKTKKTVVCKPVMKSAILISKYAFHFFLLGILFQGCIGTSPPAVIYIQPKAGKLTVLSAREVQKYIYQRSGDLLPIKKWRGNNPNEKNVIIIGDLAKQIKLNGYSLPKLKKEAYILKTISTNGEKKLLVYGGSPLGTLYAAYRFAEQLGVGFYLDGDVIPDQQIPFSIPALNIQQTPLFAIRGIQPFHDFPEGPDWWSDDDYKAIIAQLPKLGMNFIGFHTYPEGGVGPEPMVWIGPPWASQANGKVKSSYASRHFTTLEGGWGYEPMNTSEYAFGAAQMYTNDLFGAAYMMKGGHAKPKSFTQQNRLFDRFGKLLADAFSFAREIGVKTCIGTETPLTIPDQVKTRLHLSGQDPSDPKVIQKIYEGIFQRIKNTHSLDYYWFWTPESWTWSGVKKTQVDKTVSDLKSAVAAAKAVKAPFTLATSGWVLGPPQDRSLFDNILPKDMPLSAINRYVGWTPVEPGFANVHGRPKWAIPWLEDDPAITIPQLWAGRMRRDAADALSYGCTGLIGIHWRTRIIGPNVSALAKAAWSQQGWNPDDAKQSTPPANVQPGLAPYQSGHKSRDLPVADFYVKWAKIHFGGNVSREVGEIFSRLDGSKFNPKQQQAHLPRPANWVGGPGGIRPDEHPWDSVSREYLFVDTLENISAQVKGQGNLQRYNYWLHQFKYLRGMGHLNCIWFQFSKVMKKIHQSNDPEEQKALAKKDALPLRIKMITILTEVQNNLMESISTYGGLGNVTNWQQHNIPNLIREPGLQLEKYLGEPLPENATLPKHYTGETHVFVPTVRSVLNKGDSLHLKVIALSPENAKPIKEIIYWRALGDEKFKSGHLNHVARGVYEYKIASDDIPDKGLEYYIQIKFSDGTLKQFPATAPDINQIVTIIP